MITNIWFSFYSCAEGKLPNPLIIRRSQLILSGQGNVWEVNCVLFSLKLWKIPVGCSSSFSPSARNIEALCCNSWTIINTKCTMCNIMRLISSLPTTLQLQSHLKLLFNIHIMGSWTLSKLSQQCVLHFPSFFPPQILVILLKLLFVSSGSLIIQFFLYTHF